MKKIMLILLSLLLIINMVACNSQECFDCGERSARGYEIMGNFYCEDCFKSPW